MAITQEFLLSQMKRLEVNYGKDKFVMYPDLFNLWYDMFKDCNEVGVRQAVDKCIKENEFAPNIAGLMKYYKQIESAHNELVNCVKSQYALMRSVWEEPYDFTSLNELYDYTNRFPADTRKTEITEFAQKAVSFRHDCDACGRKDVPTILEYIKGVR